MAIKKTRGFGIGLLGLCGFFLLIQPNLIIPVRGATSLDWNPRTFWYEPWGVSRVHRGVDIFADHGADVLAPTHLVTVFSGSVGVGGEAVIAFDRSFRMHYFAHLSFRDVNAGEFLSPGDVVGKVGDSGNARGKQPHLHYELASVVPQLWHADGLTLGHLKGFFLNPLEWFEGGSRREITFNRPRLRPQLAYK